MKRDDLQVIRGVAILLVTIFHLHPKQFPLGFVGVDMFFVLSGFLMTVILSKDDTSYKTFLLFYTRRFQRIVPIYYLCLLATVLGCAYILLPSDKEQLLLDLKWALSIKSNIQPFYEIQGYWDQVNSYRFLTHCWSLGVEIQFYLIAPFLIAATNMLSPRLRTSSLLVLILSSVIFQITASEKVSYYHLLSRIWQFLLGVLCYRKHNRGYTPVELDESAEIAEKPAGLAMDRDPLLADSCTLLGNDPAPPQHSQNTLINELLLIVLITAIAINPQGLLTEQYTRILSCLVIFVIIRWPATESSLLLSNQLLVYLGDLSYTMYLVHWPIIVITKYYYNITSLEVSCSVPLFLIIFSITVLIHHIIEKPLTSKGSTVGITVFIISGLLMYLIRPYYIYCCLVIPSSLGRHEGINLTEVFEFNEHECRGPYPLPCDPDTTTPEWTNFTILPNMRGQSYSNGSLKILVMGNSIAYIAFPLIKELLRGRYKELRLFSISSYVLISDWNLEVTAAAHTVVEKMRPDIIWNIHSSLDGHFIRPFVNRTTDAGFLAFQKHINFYQERTRQIIIDLPYYWNNYLHVCNELLRGIQRGLPLDWLKIPKSEAIKQQIHHQARLLALNCTKCKYNNIEQFLWEDDMYWFYNRKNLHVYTTDGHHFATEFLKKLKPMYEKTIDEVLKKLET